MMRFKAVIFDIGGVLIRQPQIGIRKYEKELGFPAGFLGQVFMKGAPDNSFCRLERGELLFSEFLPEFESEVRSAAKSSNVKLSDFNAATLFAKMSSRKDQVLHLEMFSAIRTLKKNQIKTCALTNNWLDDFEENKELRASFMLHLHRFFDTVVESAREGIRKPDPNIYKMACEKLQVTPGQVIFLDDIGQNLKPASELGITCIKVENPTEAVKKLQDLVGFQLLPNKTPEHIYPPPVKPNDVPHAIANLKSGMKIHYVDVGEGPTVMLFHGFPELWYSWRYQIPALASAGYRVIAMDQRGYGDSSAPYPASDYTLKNICGDALELMDFIGIGQATIVGHDWGGAVVWELAVTSPHRLTGVCSIATPLFTGEGLKRLLSDMKTFDYQAYFKNEDVAEKELEADLSRTFKTFLRGFDGPSIPFIDDKPIRRDTTNVRERGGFLVGFPQEIPRSFMLTEDDLNYYVQQYKKSGFRGPLNWYRNSKRNAAWQSQFASRKIGIPALMMTASHDFVLRPEFTLGMKQRIPNLEQIDLKNCNHWVHTERNEEVNTALIRWLDKIHKRPSKL